MPISKTRLFRKAPKDPRYSSFPEAYNDFIDTIPPEYRIHVMTEADGGNDETGDGSLDAPYANVDYALSTIPFEERSPLKPFTKWGIIIFPGTYVAMGTENPDKKIYPDYRVSLFTDYFDNPILKLPEDKRYKITVTKTEKTNKKGVVTVTEKVTKSDNYKGHAFLSEKKWCYEIHFIGAAGNTKITYKIAPDYYDPITRKYRNCEAIAGRNKLSYLGLWPTFYAAIPATKNSPAQYTGGDLRHQQAVEFSVAQDGIYTVKYYIEKSQQNNTLYSISTVEGGAFFAGIDFDERYNYFYIDSANSNTTGFLANNDIGDVQIFGIANIDLNKSKFGGGSLAVNSKGGALVPVKKTEFMIGTKDLTAEMWINLGEKNTSGTLISAMSGIRKLKNFELYLSAQRLYAKFYNKNNDRFGNVSVGNTEKISKNAWYHVGIQRQGSNVYILYDGAIANTFKTTVGYKKKNSAYENIPETYDIATHNSSIYFGASQTSSLTGSLMYRESANIWIDEPRVTVGTARYNFNLPAVPATDLTADASTLALFSLSSYVADDSTNKLPVITKGAVVPASYTPFSETGNVYLSTHFTPQNFLAIDSTGSLDLGSDFTIDYWILISNSGSGNYTMFDRGGSFSSQKSIRLNHSRNGITISLSTTGTTWNICESLNILGYSISNAWGHYTISREGTALRVYVNGKLATTRTLNSSAALFSSSANALIGATVVPSSSVSTVNVYKLRLRNTAVSSSTISIPQAPEDYNSPDSSVLLQIGHSAEAPIDQSQNSLPINNRFRNYQNTGNVIGMAVSPFIGSNSGVSTYIKSTIRPEENYVTAAGYTRTRRAERVQNLIRISSDNTESITASTFTLEFFIKFNTLIGGGGSEISYTRAVLLSNSSKTIDRLGAGEFMFYADYGSLRFDYKKYAYPSNKEGIPTDSGKSVSLGSVTNDYGVGNWIHFAMVHDGEYTNFYMNGALKANVRTLLNIGYSDIKERPLALTNAGLEFGRITPVSLSSYLDIQINSLRLSETAVYTAPFNLNLNNPLVALPETTLFTFTEQDDYTKHNVVGDVGNFAGSPFFSTAIAGSYFFNNAELYNATSNYLDLTGNFSLEAWFYKYTPFVNGETFLSLRIPNTSLRVRYNYFYNKHGITITYPSYDPTTNKSLTGSIVFYEKVIPIRQWFHVAISRKGTVFNLFINGDLVVSRIGVNFVAENGQIVLGYSIGGGQRFCGLIKDFRFCSEPKYFAGYDAPTAPFSADPVDDPHVANVVALAHFDNENYKRKYSSSPTDSITNYGNSQKIYLTTGTHTINVSAVAHRFQNAFGFDITSPTNKIILESRRDARDNNLGFFKHPNSSVRGVHVTYSGAKLFYYQNSLLSSPPGSVLKFVDPVDTMKNKYDPFDPAYTIVKGTSKNISVGTGSSKTTKSVAGKLRKPTSTVTYGNYYNVGVEGLEFALNLKDSKQQIDMTNCTFRYVNIGYDPKANANVTSTTSLAAGSSSGYTLIKNSVFGLSAAQMRSVFTGSYSKTTVPRNYVYKNTKENSSVTAIYNPILSAIIAANTLVTTSVNFPPLTSFTGLNFSLTPKVSTNVAGVTRTLTPVYYNGATTGSVPLNPLGNTAGLVIPVSEYRDTAVPTPFPYLDLGNTILPAEMEYWSISFYMYHNGVMPGISLNYPETIMIIGNFAPATGGTFKPSVVTPNTWELTIVTYPLSFLPNSNISSRTRFGLNLRRMGTPWGGPTGKYLLTSKDPNNPKTLLNTDLSINTWYKVDISFEKFLLKMSVNNVVVAEDDFADYIKKYRVLPYPEHDFKYTNQGSTWLGTPVTYSSPFRRIKQRSFTGYIQNIRTTTGTSIKFNDYGVYSGRYKWV